MAGRRSKLTPERQDRIVKALHSGATCECAAGLAGIDEWTFYHWLRRGEKSSSGIYYQFSQAVKSAKANTEFLLTNTTYRLAIGAVFRLRMFDEEGNQMFQEDGKTPKYRSLIMPPDGNLSLRLLNIRNPRNWGAKQPQDIPPEQAGEGTPRAILDLFRAAYFELRKLGVEMPTNDEGGVVVLPPTEYRPENGPADGQALELVLPDLTSAGALPPTTPEGK